MKNDLGMVRYLGVFGVQLCEQSFRLEAEYIYRIVNWDCFAIRRLTDTL